MYVSTSQRPSGLSLWRTLLAAFAVLALVTTALGLANPVRADHAAEHPGAHTFLHEPHVGASPGDPEFACPPDEDREGWLFILTQPDAAAGELFVRFESGATFTIDGDQRGQGAMQFLVPHGDDVLVEAYTIGVTGNQLVLSHICPLVVEEVLGEFTILKLDENEDPFEGVTFRLLQNDTVVASGMTDADGTITFQDLEPGTYTLEEIAPEGYQALGPWTVVVDAEGNVTINGTAVNDDPFVIVNVLEEVENGDGILQIHKFLCPGAGDTEFEDQGTQPIGTFGTLQVQEGPCPEHVGQDFTLLQNDTVIATETTGAGGILHFFDLEPGTYTLREDATGATTSVTIEEGSITVIFVFNFEGVEEEEGLLKVIKVFCPVVGEGPVFRIIEADVDAGDLPELDIDIRECPLGDATFQLFTNGEPFGEPFTTGELGWFVGSLPVGTYTLAEVLNGEIGAVSAEFTVTEGDVTTVIVINLEEEVVEEEGRIEIIKELDECPICPTFTPGFWFNRGGGGGTAQADASLEADAIAIGGNVNATFASVADVHAWLDADLSGAWDDQPGLSATGQLLRHYLALEMNVRHSGECPLEDLVFEGQTVGQWLADARLLLEDPDATDAEMRAVQEVLAAINEAQVDDGTLVCPPDLVNGFVAGFTFELFLHDAEENDWPRTGTTDAEGRVVFENLPFGTYTIVETAPEGFECVIVEVSNEGAVLEEDGTITVTLTEENADITITVVNVCVPIEVEEEGEIVVIKDADPTDTGATFGFTFNGTDFDLAHGEMEVFGALPAGTYTVSELVDELAADWSLANIVCEADLGSGFELVNATVTIDLAAGDLVVCTFFNVFEEVAPGEGMLQVHKFLCPGEGETEFLDQGTQPIGAFGALQVGPCPEHGGQDFSIWLSLDDEEPIATDTTNAAGILHFTLDAGTYILVEDATGAWAEVTILDGQMTMIWVLNFEGVLPAEEGMLKVIKVFCPDEGTGPLFRVIEADVDAGDLPELDVDIRECPLGAATFQLFTNDTPFGEPFTTGELGWIVGSLPVGVYTLAEVDNGVIATSAAFSVTEGDVTTVIVINLEEEGVAPAPGNGVDNGEQAVLPGVGMPDTAAGTGAPVWLPILLAMGLIGSVGALATANVAARRRQ